jgi:hypothetical protein
MWLTSASFADSKTAESGENVAWQYQADADEAFGKSFCTVESF